MINTTFSRQKLLLIRLKMRLRQIISLICCVYLYITVEVFLHIEVSSELNAKLATPKIDTEYLLTIPNNISFKCFDSSQLLSEFKNILIEFLFPKNLWMCAMNFPLTKYLYFLLLSLYIHNSNF